MNFMLLLLEKERKSVLHLLQSVKNRWGKINKCCRTCIKCAGENLRIGRFANRS